MYDSPTKFYTSNFNFCVKMGIYGPLYREICHIHTGVFSQHVLGSYAKTSMWRNDFLVMALNINPEKRHLLNILRPEDNASRAELLH